MTTIVGTDQGLREVETGVTLLPLESHDPVVIAAGTDSPELDLEAALPLLTRRHRVFVAGVHVRAAELPDRFALLVGPTFQFPLIADMRVSALIVLGSTQATPDVPCPVLVIAPAGLSAACPARGDVRFAEAGHSAEQAHLIDAFLRDPQRYPAQSKISRAQP